MLMKLLISGMHSLVKLDISVEFYNIEYHRIQYHKTKNFPKESFQDSRWKFFAHTHDS